MASRGPARLRITVLSDARAAEPGLATEHGLSLLVEHGRQVLLFDAGAGPASLANARALGLPWQEVSHIVLSHGHQDHSGGLEAWLTALPKASVCLHPAAMAPRFSIHPGAPPRPIGMPEGAQRLLLQRRERLFWASAPVSLGPGLRTTGPIGRPFPGAQRLEGLFLDTEGRMPDPVADEQALRLEGAWGTVLLTGCGHAGLPNLLYRQAPLRAVIGGFHLRHAPPEALRSAQATIPRTVLVPLHCSGETALGVGESWSPQD